jgi:hypothetical protein
MLSRPQVCSPRERNARPTNSAATSAWGSFTGGRWASPRSSKLGWRYRPAAVRSALASIDLSHGDGGRLTSIRATQSPMTECRESHSNCRLSLRVT